MFGKRTGKIYCSSGRSKGSEPKPPRPSQVESWSVRLAGTFTPGWVEQGRKPVVVLPPQTRQVFPSDHRCGLGVLQASALGYPELARPPHLLATVSRTALIGKLLVICGHVHLN